MLFTKFSCISRKNNFSLFIFYKKLSTRTRWEKVLTSSEQKKNEVYWKTKVLANKEEEVPMKKEKKYILSMFPYPSGNLHMGHVRVYTISDTLARFFHMKGYKVIHPMGWDAFGLPAENAAIDRNENPAKWTKTNIKKMKNQLKDLACKFDWWREFATSDPEYYKWTQYIFLKLHEAGLAYKQKAIVNWDPVDQTVLANEQVDENGCSWRSGAKVEKKLLSQWYIRTTRLSYELYEDLSDPSLENWRDISSLQKHWIGACSGYIVEMDLLNSKGEKVKDFDHLPVWMSQPEYLDEIAFLAVKSGNMLNSDLYRDNSETTILNINALDPKFKRYIPIIVNDDLKYDQENDYYVGIPSLKEEDRNLCRELGLNIHKKLKSDVRREDIVKQLQTLNKGGYLGSTKLKDWLISRQRYWGTPIPIIKCSNCGNVPVPEENLPVELPSLENIIVKKGLSVLKETEEWLKCECPRCKKPAERETDTMDTFVDSSWYFLRFLDPKNKNNLISKEESRSLMPVDLYIGGKEHATLHLYYARFIYKFLNSIGLVSHKEPFKKLLVQGMVKSKSYQVKSSGKYLKQSEIDFSVSPPVEKETKLPLHIQYEKMSKSKHNGVDPEALIEEFGSDGVRLAILSFVGPQTERFWNPEDMNDTYKTMSKLWGIIREFVMTREEETIKVKLDKGEDFISQEQLLFETRNQLFLRINYYYEGSKQFHSVVRVLQQLMTSLMKVSKSLMFSDEYEKSLRIILLVLHPICPHLTAELWERMKDVSNLKEHKKNNSIFEEKWPSVDPLYKMELVCMVNEDDVLTIRMPQSEFLTLTQERAVALAHENERISSLLGEAPLLKVEFKYFENYKASISFMTKTPKEIKVLKKKKKMQK